jgi:DNA-binding transcriptional ArsR family regulator
LPLPDEEITALGGAGEVGGGGGRAGEAHVGKAGVGEAGVGAEAGVGEAGIGADEVFTALADPTRRRLLDQLSTQGPLSATDLAGGYSVSRQAVVKHLGALSAAGLLRSERHGRQVLYGVVPERLHEATAWLADMGARWDGRLAALAEHLRHDPG